MNVVYKKLEGFSLAEVLVCLLIVGMIAAMVIPAMVYDVYERMTVTRLIKFQATFSNAYKMLRSVYGPPEDWPEYQNQTASTRDHSIFIRRLQPFLKVMYDCGVGNNTNSLCLNKSKYYNIDGSQATTILSSYYDLVLADGTSVMFMSRHLESEIEENKKSLGVIYIDLNGPKGPNRWGYDLFELAITNDQILPRSLENKLNDEQILSECINTTGYGCSGWVLLKHNLDYIRCPDDLKLGFSSCL